MMDEMVYSSDEHSNELSADDLAVLAAFHAMDDLEVGEAEAEAPIAESPLATRPLPESSLSDLTLSLEDMLGIFAMEAEEDIEILQRALEQLGQDDNLESPAFQTLQRTAHKLKGTAGSVGCEALSMLARHIETVCRLVQDGTVVYMTGLIALAQAVRALKMTLEGILTDGEESSTLLVEVEENFRALNIDVEASYTGLVKNAETSLEEGKSDVRYAAPSLSLPTALSGDYKGPSTSAHPSSPLRTLASGVHVDARRLEELAQYAEAMVEQRGPLEHAQKRVEVAMDELYAAQVRLRGLEALFSNLPSLTSKDIFLENDELPMSSLVARIMNEAAQRRTTEDTRVSRKIQRFPQLLNSQSVHETGLWDELEIDRYTENNLLMHSLSEAIADVATASGQLRVALAQFSALVEQHTVQARMVQSHVRMLRSAPLSVLVPRLERAIQMSANAQQKQALFEVRGETIEIDQDILEALANPLLQLVRSSGVDSSIATNVRGLDEHPWHIWIYADAIGNEVVLEIGFSITVQGGVLEALHEPISQLHGSISAQRNAEGGISFHLRLPRSRGAVQGLLVRAGDARVVVPFSQVQRIDYGQEKEYEHFYVLSDLLNFPSEQSTLETARPVLILQFNGAVQVDEIVGNVELVMKPLAAHLQRPGIAGTAIDGMGNVLLILDVPELIKRWETQQSDLPTVSLEVQGAKKSSTPHIHQKILVADDSVSIRWSLRQMLGHAGYTVMEARDGMEALEQLLENPPNLLLLDIEMPNLNGYDLLSIIRTLPPSPQLAKLKIVMLTSRSSQKHKQRSLESGVDAYLTKPCPQDEMLETIGALLG